MKVKHVAILLYITLQLIGIDLLKGQTFTEQLEKINKQAQENADRLEERERYDEYMDQLRNQQRQKEVMAIQEVIKEVNEIKENTINKILSYDTFKNDIIKNKLRDIVFNYKSNCDELLKIYGSKNYSSVSNARNKIYTYSMEVLRDNLYMYLSDMEIEREKLSSFITSNVLTPKQIEKIEKDYNRFLQEPFNKDLQGNYVGYSFDINRIKSLLPSSATAFAITSNGLLVTNYHVVEDADSIIVKGINGDYVKEYNAKVVILDKSNDLAILKIVDNSFMGIGKIPFTIKSSISDVGENIFVLGYPLTKTMGQEVKLTNGIISSKTGFEGNMTLYQISAPIQPGNSGGPLFDNKGNLIGIINAKHVGAENVSYAIKSIYLMNLIGSMEKVPLLTTKSTLKTKSLSDLVKKLEKFVYIVEVR